MKKPIKVIRDNMSAKQAQEAQLFGMKHEDLFPHVERHTFEGNLGTYKVRCLKMITVEMV